MHEAEIMKANAC